MTEDSDEVGLAVYPKKSPQTVGDDLTNLLIRSINESGASHSAEED